MRNFISKTYSVNYYTDDFANITLNDEVFEDAVVDACIIIITNKTPNKNSEIIYNDQHRINQSFYGEESWSFGDIDIINLKHKLESKGEKLKELPFINIYYGIKTGFNEAFIIDKRLKNILVQDDPKSEELIKPVLRGRDIDQYKIDTEKRYLINTGYSINVKEKYKAIYNYLLDYKDKLVARSDQGLNWYNLRTCDYYPVFEQSKILYGEIINSSPNRPKFYFDTSTTYVEASGFMITSKKESKLLLAILNSTLSMFYIKSIGSTLNTNGIRYKKTFLDELPLLLEVDNAIKDEIISRVNQIVSISATMNEETKITRKNAVIYEEYKDNIKILADEIDILIMEIYGVTKEEYLMMLEYVELKGKSEIVNRDELSLLSNKERMIYVEKLSKLIPKEKFDEEHIKKKKTLEVLAEEYGFEYATLSILRQRYAGKHYSADPWNIYQVVDFQKRVITEILFKLQDVLETNHNYKNNYELYALLSKEFGVSELAEMLDVMKVHEVSKRSEEVIAEILNNMSDTFNSFIKKVIQEKKTKEFVKYDTTIYGLSSWSDETHKRYFIDALDYYTSNSDEKFVGTAFEGIGKTKRRAETALKNLEQLEFEDKEEYLRILTDKVKKAFD